jgi:hypothetical protein
MEKRKLLTSGKGIAIVLMAAIGIWALAVFFGLFTEPSEMNRLSKRETDSVTTLEKHTAAANPADHEAQEAEKSAAAPQEKADPPKAHGIPEEYQAVPAGSQPEKTGIHGSQAAAAHATPTAAEAHAEASEPAAAKDHAEKTAPVEPPKKGVTFMEACMKPLDYELNERFWGWRPNDILDFTDNVNSFQLGVLEVTRRTSIILAERISRTGSTDSFDPNLQNAMNWFMIKADRYWFPSPEGKFKDGLEEMRTYTENLKIGSAHFYSRTVNLIPLLVAYEDLLGSCDDNLVKT